MLFHFQGAAEPLVIYTLCLPSLQYLSSLQLMAQWYNQVKQTVLEVELPLIRAELTSVDLQLSRAESVLTWQDPDCLSFIGAAKDQVQNLACRVGAAKEKCEAIQSTMKTWAKQAMFCRRDNKKSSLIQLDDRQDRVRRRFSSMEKDGELIHKLVQVKLIQHCLPNIKMIKIYFYTISESVYI